MKQLIIKTAKILPTGMAVLTFKSFPDDVAVMKPVGSLLLTLEETGKAFARVQPSFLVDSILTVEDSKDIQGNVVKGVIEPFKKGDAYIVTENNTVVKNGTINPVTNAPYQVGDTAYCETSGIRITGRMNLQLSEKSQARVDASYNAVAEEISRRQMLGAVKSVSSASSSNVSNYSAPEPTVTEETPEGAEEVIEGVENF